MFDQHYKMEQKPEAVLMKLAFNVAPTNDDICIPWYESVMAKTVADEIFNAEELFDNSGPSSASSSFTSFRISSIPHKSHQYYEMVDEVGTVEMSQDIREAFN